jgi:hypothetical protein
MLIKYGTYKTCQSLMGPKFSRYESKLKSRPGALEFRFIFHVHLSLFSSKPFSAMQRSISLVFTKKKKRNKIHCNPSKCIWICNLILTEKYGSCVDQYDGCFCLNLCCTNGEILLKLLSHIRVQRTTKHEMEQVRWSNVKVTIEQTTKAQRGSRCIALLFLKLRR